MHHYNFPQTTLRVNWETISRTKVHLKNCKKR